MLLFDGISPIVGRPEIIFGRIRVVFGDLRKLSCVFRKSSEAFVCFSVIFGRLPEMLGKKQKHSHDLRHDNS